MKRIILFLMAIASCWTLCGQTISSEDVPASAPKKYHSPAFYAATSVVPGLGQFLLGEPVKGTILALTSVGSVVSVWGGAYLGVASSASAGRDNTKDMPGAITAAVLFLGGQIVWLGTEIFSVTDAFYSAKFKRYELSVQPTIVYNPNSADNSYAPGVCLAFCF